MDDDMASEQRNAPTTGTRIIRGATAGLIAGVLASFAMDRFQGLTSADDDDSEPTTAKAAAEVRRVMTGAPFDKADQSLAGQIVHYALGTALGVAYGIAAEFKPHVTIGYSAAFGIGVAAVLDEAAVPAAGLADAPWKTDAGTQFYALVSHLVFGTVAELTRRQVRGTLLSAD